MGFLIALDDAGSGFSSFADLRDYPIDIVKIDRSILNAAVTQRGVALLRGIAAVSYTHLMGEYRSYPQYEVISACDGAFEMLNAPMPGEKLVWRYDDTYCIFSDRQVAVGRGTRQTVVPIPEGMFFSHSSTIGEMCIRDRCRSG